MTTHTPKRLRVLGYEATSDGPIGYEIWKGRTRVGRVFSRAALEAWQPPAPEPTRAARWPEEGVFPGVTWIAGQLCYLVQGSAAAGHPRYEPDAELTAIWEAANGMRRAA